MVGIILVQCRQDNTKLEKRIVAKATKNSGFGALGLLPLFRPVFE